MGINSFPKFVPPQEKQRESAADARQQNKIIKIVESGDLDVLNQPLAAISGGGRDSFFEKVREGKITEETLDSGVVCNIGAPFSRQDGMQTLRDQIRSNPRLQKDFSGTLRESIYKGARYREDQQLAIEDLARFIQMCPTPRAFDSVLVGNRLQELQVAYEKEQQPGRRDALKMEISLQRQKEREMYPRLRAALYGKRNEYWEQVKLLLKEARGNEAELSESRTTAPEGVGVSHSS